ncbi:GNAT family N-acetyltransferase [Dyadobacter sandarakinus]|uniref:GNAT family N-acetyltransferase n=1 Tax=Dyadobacter sandarakinus TaxID=2747268 RepID=A0ABX7I657_9BACT|nr:GNAT family N-acetyltransferase [Dyadobacter sandarakinus]QRR01592.1 GNAT family N-acetyltransferase [Dyadobacter sandarakinus]
MEPITITEAGLADLAAVQQIARETFFETFVGSNTEADMQQYLAENFSDTKLAAELSNPDSWFFVAHEGEQVIGYLKLNAGKAQTELHEDDSLEIERIYVKHAYHGKRIGQLLYEKALSMAEDKKVSSLWLGVWEENAKAIRFYEKNGFTAFSKHIFRFGEDEQTDVMMRKVLV